MELIDKKQVESLKRLGRRIGGDPARLRLTICVLLTGLGIFGVERPLGMRLARARTANVAAKKASQMAEDVAFFTRQKAGYEARAAVSSDISDWQNYVLDPDSAAARQAIEAAVRADRTDLRRLLEDVDVRGLAEDALRRRHPAHHFLRALPLRP